MIDWAALGDETVDLLRRYLMIDTTNPPGNEIAGVRFLADVLARDGIESETIEAAPGRGSLRARLVGDGSLGGIVLHHHIDVVYADRRYWSVDPFGGVIADGYLYGRGAIDMKSTGILQLAAIWRSSARACRSSATSCSWPPPTRRPAASTAPSSSPTGGATGWRGPSTRSPSWPWSRRTRSSRRRWAPS